MRIIKASQDVETRMKLTKSEQLNIYSFFPVDQAECDCQDEIMVFKKRLATMKPADREQLIAQMGHFECTRTKIGLKRYEISCSVCGQVQGYCWATSPDLHDWCDFHYTQWTDGKQWFGCLTPNVSPITGQLGLECCCGNDTRDFRANVALPIREAVKKEDSNKEGREFNTKASKFTVRRVRDKMKPVFSLKD